MSIPPKYAVAAIVGYVKGKSAIHIARTYRGKERNFTGENCWARGYFVTTVGADEQTVREYIRDQEQDDIQSVLSRNMIPAIDIEITDPTTIDDLMAAAKDHDRTHKPPAEPGVCL